MVLEVGWQDCQSSPTRTLHPLLTSLWRKNAHALTIRVLSIAVHSHAEGFLPVFRLHAQDFAGFTHAVVFSVDL